MAHLRFFDLQEPRAVPWRDDDDARQHRRRATPLLHVTHGAAGAHVATTEQHAHDGSHVLESQ